MKQLSTIDEIKELGTNSGSQPYFIFKHSTICPTSSRAEQNVKKFIQENEAGGQVYQVLVIENRALSNQVAEYFSISHESPQILLIKDGKCIWNASHLAINEEVMEEKLQGVM